MFVYYMFVYIHIQNCIYIQYIYVCQITGGYFFFFLPNQLYGKKFIYWADSQCLPSGHVQQPFYFFIKVSVQLSNHIYFLKVVIWHILCNSWVPFLNGDQTLCDTSHINLINQ